MHKEILNSKMFRAQLCYFEDVDYSEAVNYLLPNPPSNDEIKNSLLEMVQKGIYDAIGSASFGLAYPGQFI